MDKRAVFSDDRHYRYGLWRIWDAERPLVMFVGLNPSIADEQTNDPTLRRCLGFAQSWNCGGVVMANLFAYVTPRPTELLQTADPIGPENDRWLRDLGAAMPLQIAAWGNHGSHRDRAQTVRSLLPALQVLQINRTGQPAHPLYLPTQLQPQPWEAKSVIDRE